MPSSRCWGLSCWTISHPTSRLRPESTTWKVKYIKAAKNMSSVFAGFGYAFHQENPGVLPTLLTLLLDQCLDQAATVSMARPDRQKLYHRQPIPLTELGYAVPRIEATLVRDGDFEKVRDHTFTQLTAMVVGCEGQHDAAQFGQAHPQLSSWPGDGIPDAPGRALSLVHGGAGAEL